MTEIKDQGPGNFVTGEFILGKEVQPRFSFCLSPGGGWGGFLRVSERLRSCSAAL